jgi:hypothetical protein
MGSIYKTEEGGYRITDKRMAVKASGRVRKGKKTSIQDGERSRSRLATLFEMAKRKQSESRKELPSMNHLRALAGNIDSKY